MEHRKKRETPLTREEEEVQRTGEDLLLARLDIFSSDKLSVNNTIAATINQSSQAKNLLIKSRAQIRMTTKRIARLPKDAGIPIIVGDASWDESPQAAYVALVVAGYRPVRDCICNIMTREPSYSVTALVCLSLIHI